MNSALRMIAAFLCLGIPQIFAASASPRQPLQHQQFVPYWTTEPGWHTDLQLRNNLQESVMTVGVLLRLADGTEFSLPEVTIAPNDVKMVDLREALASVAPQLAGSAGSFGSLVFRYSSFSTSNLYASVMIHLDGHPIEYHVDAFHVTAKASMADYDGMWWVPQPSVNQFLVLGNYSKTQAKARISLFSDVGVRANTTDLSLGPGQTVRIDLQDAVRKAGLTGTYGGLSLHCSNAVATFPFQFIYDESSGFSALMKLHRHHPDDKPSLVTLRAAMVGLSNPDPALKFPSGTTLTARVFLRNTTNQKLPVDVLANWRLHAESGATNLGSYVLGPQQTTLLDLSGMQKHGALQAEANWAEVSVQFNGREGDVMAISSSYDATWQHGLQSPFTTQLAGLWAGGMWHADTLQNSLIATGNGGTKPTVARLKLNFHGGSYEIKSKPLAPGEQLWLDVGDLKQRQVPDEKGNVIPLSAVSGTYEIEDMNDSNLGSLFEGKLTVDKTFGHAAYGCSNCCGDDFAWLDPNPLATAMGSGAQDDLWGSNECFGTQTKRTGSSYNWSSSNTGVATMGPGKGWVNGISAGSSNITGYFRARLDDGYGGCVFQDVGGGGGGCVGTLAFSGTANNFIFVGTDSNILSGNVFFLTGTPPGGTYAGTTSKSGDSVTLSPFSGLEKAVIQTATQSASNLDRTLSFTYTVNSCPFKLEKAVTARQFAYLTNDSPSNQCTLGHGTDRTYTYTVYTHPDQAAVDANSGIDGTPATETFSPPPPCGGVTGNGALNVNGQFTDHVVYCGTQPLTCTGTTTQTLRVAGVQVRTNTLTFTSSGVGYTNNGPNQ